MKIRWRTIISVIITLALLFEISPIYAAAAVNQAENLYIKEIKIFSEEDYKSPAADGYTIFETDLNQGTAGGQVYLGYKTTDDPAEAIYDMKLMNMNGGYQYTNIETIYQQQSDNFTTLTNWMMTLFTSYQTAYQNQSPMALAVFDALNIFRLETDESSGDPVGDGIGTAIVNGDAINNEFIMEFILLCNSTYIDTVVKLLVAGIQGQNYWLNDLSNLGPYSSSVDYTGATSYVNTSEELEAAAKSLLPILQQHAQIYNLMEKSGAFYLLEVQESGGNQAETPNQFYTPTIEESEILQACLGLEEYYKTAFDALEEYAYGKNQTLKDFFCSLEKLSPSQYTKLYPLLSVLNEGQYAALYFGCVPDMFLGSLVVPANEATDNDLTAGTFDACYKDIVEEAKATFGIDKVYLYDGVDDALLNPDTTIAFTEEAERHKAETGEADYYQNNMNRDKEFQSNIKFTAFIAAGCIGVMAVSKISMGITAIIVGAKSLAALGSLAGFKGTFCSFVVSVSGIPGIIVTAIVVLITFLYALWQYVSDYWEENYPDWDDYPIPNYIYDISNTSNHIPVYTMYEAVKQNGTNEPADLNTFEGKQWLVLYVSYDNVDGTRNPIKADTFLLNESNGDTPAGYTPLCEFGEVIAKDLNAYERSNSTNGLYLFYQQDEQVEVESTSTYYIKDIYMATGYSDSTCLDTLKNKGFTPINYNLTPHYIDYAHAEGRKIYTYIGYQLTTNPNDAIRDLRMTYNYNASAYTHGQISYGEHGTSGMVTLYASKVEAAGTPIVADGLLVTENRNAVPAGYEPVNLFSGGPAVSFNHSDCMFNPYGTGSIFLYFLPETTFTEGPDYLSGIAHYEDHYMNLFEGTKPADINSPVTIMLFEDALEFWTGSSDSLKDYDSVKSLLNDLYAWNFGYDDVYQLDDGDHTEYFLCHKTKNPYRAIYSIEGTNMANTSPLLAFNGSGYTGMAKYSSYIDLDYDVSMNLNSTSTVTGNFFLAGNLINNTLLKPEEEKAPETEEDNTPKTVMKTKDPILYSDVFVEVMDDTEITIPERYTPVQDMFEGEATDVILKGRYTEKNVRLHTVTEGEEKLPYISKIYATDYASVFRAYEASNPGLTSDYISKALTFPTLASQGATEFCAGNFYTIGLRLEESYTFLLNGYLNAMNVTNFGYSRTKEASAALRDLIIVTEDLSQGNPDKTITVKGYKYNLQCEIGLWNYTGLDDNFTPRVYLYGSTDARLGAPITEFNVDTNLFTDGYYTVLTPQGKDMYSEIFDDFIHSTSPNKGNNSELTKLCDEWQHLVSFAVGTSYANGVYTHEDMDYYLHFKREGTSPLEEKPYITNIRVVDRDWEERYALSVGAEGIIPIGDKMIIYDRSANPGDAITDLRITHEKYDYIMPGGYEYSYVGQISSDSYLYATYETETPISTLERETETKSDKDTDTMTYSYVKESARTVGKYYDDSAKTYYYLSMGRLNDTKVGTYSPPKDFTPANSTSRLTFNGTETGTYVSGIFIMDKNTIRQEKMDNGTAPADCECADITETEVHNRLKEMGATTILDNYIQTNTDDDNRIYIGITRTNDKTKALKDVVLYTDLIAAEVPDDKITINKKAYYLVADPNGDAPINLLATEDSQGLNGNGVTQIRNSVGIYLYVSKTAGDYLYDLTLDNNPIVNGTKTVVSQNGMEAFEDLAEQAKSYNARVKDSPHFLGLEYQLPISGRNVTIEGPIMEFCESVNDTYHPEEEEINAWYLHTKNYPESTIEKTKPYITEIFITYGDSEREAIAELLKKNIDGFINIDSNKSAGGDYVYIGYRRSANTTKDKAITDLVICEGKNPTSNKTIQKKDSGVTSTYQLVANVDLNKDAGGDWLYLYQTKNKSAGNPLTDIYISEGRGNTVDEIKGNYKHSTVLLENTEKKVDINNWAGGKYLYLIQVRQLQAASLNDFIVIVPPISTLQNETTGSNTNTSSTSNSASGSSSASTSGTTKNTTQSTTQNTTKSANQSTANDSASGAKIEELPSPESLITGNDNIEENTPITNDAVTSADKDSEDTGSIISTGSLLRITLLGVIALAFALGAVWFARRKQHIA